MLIYSSIEKVTKVSKTNNEIPRKGVNTGTQVKVQQYLRSPGPFSELHITQRPHAGGFEHSQYPNFQNLQEERLRDQVYMAIHDDGPASSENRQPAC